MQITKAQINAGAMRYVMTSCVHYKCLTFCICVDKCCVNSLIKYRFVMNVSDHFLTSQKHLRTKMTPDFHLTYSTNWGNLGSESK